MSQTPNFDKAINEILTGIKPLQKPCPQCGAVFDIFQEDIEFYKMFKVPPPTLCPQCRLQRRMGYRINIIPVFYKKECYAPGHNEKVISTYAPDNPFKIYDYSFWHSDAWDPLDFARVYDFSQLFFEQFKNFVQNAPHPAIYKDPKGVNSEYVVSGLQPKNCYYSAVPYNSENIYYGSLILYSKDCLDCLYLDGCQSCYSSANLFRCHSCFFCYDSQECLNSFFLFNCRNCQDCFACFGLKNKKHCIFNKQYSEQEYWPLVDKIKSQMLVSGEYGQFLPLKISWAPYNDSSASVDFPLPEIEIRQRGWHFQEEAKSEIDLSKIESVKAGDLPDGIKDVSDDILDKAIICDTTNKPFKLTKFELDFYRQHNLPLPIEHPSERIKNHLRDFRHPYKLWKDVCFNCKKDMNSGWDPAKKYKVYCETCYLKEVV